MPASLPTGVTRGPRFDDWTARVPRYVVCDVDGTLVASGTTASPPVAAAVAAARRAGLHVGIATGRLPQGLRALQAQLRLTVPAVVHNGAQVVHEGRALHSWPLPSGAASDLAALLAQRDLYGELYTGTRFLVTDRRPAAHRAWEIVSGPPDGLVDELDLDVDEVLKATVTVHEDDELDHVLTGAAALGLAAEASTSPMFPGELFVNVTAPGVGKGVAVAAVATGLGVAAADVLAVGDGMNDLTMLAAAGTAVAMAGSPAPLLALAHLVVADAASDGAAAALHAAVGWAAGRGPTTGRGGPVRSTR
ncbi:Cof-type HAD-IIB family hydrolase [Rhodococcus antarcticus]|uniref:Cof-type HAD-IIB family hydrolase n=1 Tax=Rhodococcus antarcticus TaxID=2987751 RepID=A0ABY6NXP4_9NOCA|nr:HAD family hydrolase [Rhodococcus antarcticus]UZJ24140.1 Cof-type HAD-IIB family hydrolase [Rhodococcus antarcticus]